ncbi:MAG: hypothetical protein JWP12_2495 [Bacteroidetes bacterium]|nr:hypothetical protein [Bacteroidota bacterium]
MKKITLTFIAICFAAFSFSQTGTIQKLYSDTAGNDKEFNKALVQYISHYKKDTLPFSSLNFTKVVAYKINELYFTGKESYELCEPYSIVNKKTKKLSPKVGKKEFLLTDDQIKKLTNIFSDSDNFIWAECGTPIPQAGLVFYKKDKIVGFINIACYYGQVECVPAVLQAKYGALSESGAKQLVELYKEIFGANF